MWLDWIAHKLHIASGKKMVTYGGAVVASVGATCSQLGSAWFNEHAPWMHGVCAAATFIGLFVTMLGKGIADRRTDTERSPDDGGGL